MEELCSVGSMCLSTRILALWKEKVKRRYRIRLKYSGRLYALLWIIVRSTFKLQSFSFQVINWLEECHTATGVFHGRWLSLRRRWETWWHCFTKWWTVSLGKWCIHNEPLLCKCLIPYIFIEWIYIEFWHLILRYCEQVACEFFRVWGFLLW